MGDHTDTLGRRIIGPMPMQDVQLPPPAGYVRADIHAAVTAERDRALAFIDTLNIDAIVAERVEELRAQVERYGDQIDTLAAERDALRAQVARMREALEPFASAPMHGAYGGPLVSAQTHYEDGSDGDDLGISPSWRGYLPHEAFRRARAALSTPPEPTEGAGG